MPGRRAGLRLIRVFENYSTGRRHQRQKADALLAGAGAGAQLIMINKAGLAARWRGSDDGIGAFTEEFSMRSQFCGIRFQAGLHNSVDICGNRVGTRLPKR